MILKTPKNEKNNLVNNIAESLSFPRTVRPSGDKYLAKLVRTTDAQYFLIMFGGKEKKHEKRADSIERLELGEMAVKRQIKYNGCGNLNCSIFNLQDGFAELVIERYDEQKEASKTARSEQEERRVEEERLAKLETMSPEELDAEEAARGWQELLNSGTLTRMARVTYNRRPEPEQPTKEEFKIALLDKLKERSKDANSATPEIERLGAVYHTTMSSRELLKPAGSAVQLIFGFGAALQEERSAKKPANLAK